MQTYDWMAKAWLLADDLDRSRLKDDALKEDQRQNLMSVGYRAQVATDYLRAMKLAGRNDVPESLRDYLDSPLPAAKEQRPVRYRAWAWLALVEAREADAQAYFQRALFIRDSAPRFFRGKLEDPLLDDAQAAFLRMGGTEKGFALWSKPLSATRELTSGKWEKPTKVLPPFDLADTTGKKWTLKQLEGRAVLINLWATWCGPCLSELPHLQKLYERTRDRSDVQVISFNVDEDVGLLEPFLKEHGFTFPSVIASSLVRGMFNGFEIPQNWLLDPQGNWIATQLGFDVSDSDWLNSMLKRLDLAKEGKVPGNPE